MGIYTWDLQAHGTAIFQPTALTMHKLLPCVFFAFCANPALAEVLVCNGVAPEWQATLNNTDATFEFRGKTTTFDIPHIAYAEGDSETRAYSLIGDMDTAIVIVTQAGQAHVLTQDRSVPILLEGRCE